MDLRTIEPVRTKQAALVREMDQLVSDAYDAPAAATFAETLHSLALQTRLAIGAHQCALSFVPLGDFKLAVHTHSFSEKYEKYNTYDVMPTGDGIWGLVVTRKMAVRMTQEELVSHPMWKNFCDLRDQRGLEHPPMRGWLAAPVLRKSSEVMGVLQLSDKYDDAEFTAKDLDLLIHLASVVLPAFELQSVNKQLQDRKMELQAQRRAALNLAQDAEEARKRAERGEESLAKVNAALQREIVERERVEEELRRTADSLDRVASELALPPRNLRAADTRFHISQFSLTDMITCGAVLRGMSVGQRDSRRLADDVVRFLYDHFLDEAGNRAFALVRFFETRFFHQLDPELQAVATTFPGTGPQTMCLMLQATAGDDPRWNDPKQSAAHRAIPLVSAEAVDRLPMIAQLLRQLGLNVAGLVSPSADVVLSGTTTGVFHIAEARGSRWIPAQERFVVPCGIRSVVGFGDLLPGGPMFVVIAFSKVPITQEIARLLAHLSLSLKMALQPLIESSRKTEAQILALDKLLHNYEVVVAEQETALHRQTQALIRSNTDLEQFAYIASHDLQEPLRKVQSFGDLLAAKSGEALGAEGRDYLKRMQNAAQRMQGLISELLSFARVTSQAKPFVPVDLAPVAQEVVSDLEARIKSTGGRVDIGALPRLDSDPLQMRQLLQNLIGNALKFYRPEVPPEVAVQARVVKHGRGAGLMCEITVQDNGIGFEEKYLERIFAPFQRLHGLGEYEGTGMGLAICRKIVARHGGTITARSAPGQGATFTVTLPLRQPKGEPRHA